MAITALGLSGCHGRCGPASDAHADELGYGQHGFGRRPPAHHLDLVQRYAAPTVAINIIRKTSDNPATYVLVRQVASSTANDGDAVWVPALGDVGPNTYIQVACVESAQACTSAPLNVQPLAVVNDGKNANTASAYQAIEAEYNN